MTEEKATCEVKAKKIGRPPKDAKGERMWIPAECVEFVKSYLEFYEFRKTQGKRTEENKG